MNKTKPETNPQISKNKKTTSKSQTQPQNTNPSEITTRPKMTGKTSNLAHEEKEGEKNLQTNQNKNPR